MQSRLAAAAVAARKLNFSGRQELKIGFATSTGRTADPAVHTEDPEEVGVGEAILDVKRRQQQANETTTAKDDDPYVTPKSPIESGPKIEHPAVSPLVNPVAQQKRRKSTQSAFSVDDISCVGLDGSPWPAEDRERSMEEQRREQEEEQKEYFKHHKASPLSEIEIADTRKPITRATDGTVKSDKFGYDVSGVITWMPEQLDSAEDSLRRAMEIFRANASRGDPDSPHGRVLRKMRGEYW